MEKEGNIKNHLIPYEEGEYTLEMKDEEAEQYEIFIEMEIIQ